MNIRAAICDVYNTLLEVGPPPFRAEDGWNSLFREWFGGCVSASLSEFHARCEAIITREHTAARSVGIAYPEIFWPEVVAEALPEISSLPPQDQDEFLFRHAGLRHSVRLMPGVAEALRMLSQNGILLGIASNAQPYTLRELDTALETVSLSRSIFLPEAVFWSFEHGFSKPDPHSFRFVQSRLRARGIAASEIVMIGDREDNDIAPARAQGWQTWRLAKFCEADAGDWHTFSERVSAFAISENPPNPK